MMGIPGSLTNGDNVLGTSTLASMTEGFWHKLWMRAPAATESGVATDWLGMWLFWFCTIWFVGLMGIMLYFVIRYRRGRVGPVAPSSSAHNTPLELAWTVIPSLFLVFMFFKGFWAYIDKLVAPGNATEIMLTGSKWSWDFAYPTGARTQTFTELGARRTTTPVFYVPAGKPVKVRMISTDVIHAFWVPDFRVKQDVIPNRYTTLWFEAKAPSGDRKLSAKEEPAIADKLKSLEGTPYEDHWVFCAEYCGTEHSEMAAIIRAVPADAYQKWLDFVSDPSGLAPAKHGEIVYKSQCASCHSVDGAANTGPTWLELYGNPAIPLEDGSKVVGDENYIRKSVREPAFQIHAGFKNQMTPFPTSALSDAKLEAIISYMKYVSKFTSQEVKDEVMRKKEDAGAMKK